MRLQVDPLTVIVVAFIIGGLSNLVAVSAAEENREVDANTTTETRMCLLCWDNKTKVNIEASHTKTDS